MTRPTWLGHETAGGPSLAVLVIALVTLSPGCMTSRTQATRFALPLDCPNGADCSRATLASAGGAVALRATRADLVEARDEPLVSAAEAVVYASEHGDVFPRGEVRGSVVSPLFGSTARWMRIALSDGTERLVAHRAQGGLSLTAIAGCEVDGVVGCSIADARWGDALRYYWLPDIESTARAMATVAYDVELGRAGLGGQFSPLLRRVDSGGFGIGLAFSYVDFGLRQRFAVAVTFECDLSYLVRQEIGGRERSWNLAVGADVGLGILAVPSDFDQALLLGLGVAPYAELRGYVTPSVVVPVRLSVDVTAGRLVTWYPAVSVGLGMVW